MALAVHELVLATNPKLEAKTWYGMPAYALDGQVVCFFQAALKYKTRYATLGFREAAKLDEEPIWPTSFALTKMTDEVSAAITELVRRATGL